MIWATWFRPYFSITYSNTLDLPSSSKSISISGIEILSGLRNRSKSKSYFMGSILVMPRQYATADPAADPRPGPTETPIFLAVLVKSCTMRKYPGYPELLITCNSKFNLSSITGLTVPYRSLAPSKVRCFKYASCVLNPCGNGNAGSKTSRVRFNGSILSTISMVLSSASGISLKTLCISSLVLK